ncbi:MAG TPA: hypothetical protein PLP86_12540, partial [Armatimonadota bacterium]|nr:hypothetical protein [Armatimonadota bacterium]
RDMTIVKSLGLTIILVSGLIISLTIGITLIPNEVDRRTIYTILSKPVKRYEFVIGKFLGGLLTLSVNIWLMGIVFIVMLAIKAALIGEVSTGPAGFVGDVRPETYKVQIFDPSMLLGILMIYFQFFLLSAVVMCFSVFMTPTVNFFASFAVYLVGSAAPIWASLAADKEKTGLLVRGFYKVIHTIIPNFDYFNISNRLIHPHHEVRSLPLFVSESIAYALVYVCLLLIIASIVFDSREV